MLRHITFGDSQKTLAIFVQNKDMVAKDIVLHYLKPLEALGIPREDVIVLSLEQNAKGKSPMAIVRPCLAELERIVQHLNIKTVLCCDGAYFKPLAMVKKTEVYYGYPCPSQWKDVTVFLCANYRALFYNPPIQSKISMALRAVAGHVNKTGGVFQHGVLQDPEYPTDLVEIKNLLLEYLKLPAIYCDIETYHLNVDKAGLGTIAFSRDKHRGFALSVNKNSTIRTYLKEFFANYTGTIRFHGSPFDGKILIWELFMSHPRDIDGMLRGLHCIFRNFDDTKIIAYLALNSTAGVSLKLKDLAFEYTGNYAQDDINDIRKIPLDELLEYNLTDCVATAYVYEKYRNTLVGPLDRVYEELFKPALKVITQMELCGMPINLDEVRTLKALFTSVAKKYHDAIMTDPHMDDFHDLLRERAAEKANAQLKVLRKTKDDFIETVFNPNSPVQLALLLHDHFKLPVLDRTDKGAPSTSEKALQALKARVQNGRKWDKSIIALLNNIIELHDVNKMLSTFIPAFENNSIKADGWFFLQGCFNLGGAKSGRLSSSDPNLTNLPSNEKKQYAKPVKQCFSAPEAPTEDSPQGWLMVGADYASLEDKVSALQTKDPNKLKIYTDGYDGHCLRAYKYFSEQMPDIDPNNVDSINSIAEKYSDLRQMSKSPTFLLTYMGTHKGLMKQFGFNEKTAKSIYANYHELYKVSDEWVWDKIKEASNTGYVELAFGLRLKTPILPQVVVDSDSVPYQAHKEIKTAGNALGQSYGLLNTRSANEFMERVWKSKYASVILPICQIHDSQYYMIQNSLGCLRWVNNNLIDCMEWNKLPDIQHPTIKLSAGLEVYWPDWAHKISIPNRISLRNLHKLLQKYEEQKDE